MGVLVLAVGVSDLGGMLDLYVGGSSTGSHSISSLPSLQSTCGEGKRVRRKCLRHVGKDSYVVL